RLFSFFVGCAGFMVGAGIMGISVSGSSAAGAGNWTTFHRDAQRTGYDPDNEGAFCGQACVSTAWSQALNGLVRGQPLVWNDLVFVASDSNDVYAFNAAGGALVWHTSIGPLHLASQTPACDSGDPVIF